MFYTFAYNNHLPKTLAETTPLQNSNAPQEQEIALDPQLIRRVSQIALGCLGLIAGIAMLAAIPYVAGAVLLGLAIAGTVLAIGSFGVIGACPVKTSEDNHSLVAAEQIEDTFKVNSETEQKEPVYTLPTLTKTYKRIYGESATLTNVTGRFVEVSEKDKAILYGRCTLQKEESLGSAVFEWAITNLSNLITLCSNSTLEEGKPPLPYTTFSISLS